MIRDLFTNEETAPHEEPDTQEENATFAHDPAQSCLPFIN